MKDSPAYTRFEEEETTSQGCKKFIFPKVSGVDLPAVLGGEGGLLLGRVHVGPEGPLGVRAALVLQGAQLDLVQPGGDRCQEGSSHLCYIKPASLFHQDGSLLLTSVKSCRPSIDQDGIIY